MIIEERKAAQDSLFTHRTKKYRKVRYDLVWLKNWSKKTRWLAMGSISIYRLAIRNSGPSPAASWSHATTGPTVLRACLFWFIVNSWCMVQRSSGWADHIGQIWHRSFRSYLFDTGIHWDELYGHTNTCPMCIHIHTHSITMDSIQIR